MERFTILLVLLAIGCGGGASSAPPPSTPKPAAAVSEPPSAPTTSMRGEGGPPPTATPATPTTGGSVDVNTKDTPVLRCGPGDSYKFVAGEFKCQDGSNPFNGDAKLGRANSQGHVIDLYEVPCPEGPRRVYVDMYGCGGAGAKI